MRILFLMIWLSIFPCVIFAAQPLTPLTFLGSNQSTLINADASAIAEGYGYQLTAFNLDALTNLEKSISKDLPKDLAQAEALANERLGGLDQSEMMNFVKGPALLMRWDIKKLPAFVFGDGEYVIYGLTDINVALQRFTNSRKRN